MPGIGTGATSFVQSLSRTWPRAHEAPQRHNHHWDRTEEDTLLGRFAAGESLRDIAHAHQRTFGAVNGRLAQLLGIRWPETPEQYRRSGRPIRRRTERRTTPRETAPPQSLVEPARWPTFISTGVLRTNSSWVQPPAPPHVQAADAVDETPPHLKAVVPLSKQHFEAMAAAIKALRPIQEGRAAAAQHSTLNKLAYKLASLFEGDDSSFDRARWLEACGVQTAQRN